MNNSLDGLVLANNASLIKQLYRIKGVELNSEEFQNTISNSDNKSNINDTLVRMIISYCCFYGIHLIRDK